MSDLATISMKIGNEIVGVFVKYGGEREVLGQILQEQFTDVSAIHKLLAKGAIVNANDMTLYSEETPEIWKSSSINEFMGTYGMKRNYVFDKEENVWVEFAFNKMNASIN